MSTSTPTMTIATRLRSSRRRASRHGLAATTAGSAASEAATSPTTAPLTEPPAERLLHPGLVDQPVELLAEREVADALRQEVDVPRREQRRHRRLVRHLSVDLRPELVRRREVLFLELQRVVHLVFDRLVAEACDVDARVAPWVERLAAEQDVEEVRCGRVVLIPLLNVDLHLVLRVLGVGEEDVPRDRLRRRLEPDLVQDAGEIDADRLVHLVVRREHGHLRALLARLLDELLRLRDVRCRPVGARLLRVRSAGGDSSVQSYWPFSIAVICASTVRPNFWVI